MTCVFALLVQICAIPGGSVGQIWAKEHWPGGILLQTYAANFARLARCGRLKMPYPVTPPYPHPPVLTVGLQQVFTL